MRPHWFVLTLGLTASAIARDATRASEATPAAAWPLTHAHLVRTNPLVSIHVVQVPLRDARIRFRVARGGPDPDGAGPAAPFSIPKPDFNLASMRLNVVFRWEFRPGSSIFAWEGPFLHVKTPSPWITQVGQNPTFFFVYRSLERVPGGERMSTEVSKTEKSRPETPDTASRNSRAEDRLLERLAEWDNFQSVLGLTRALAAEQEVPPRAVDQLEERHVVDRAHLREREVVPDRGVVVHVVSVASSARPQKPISRRASSLSTIPAATSFFMC